MNKWEYKIIGYTTNWFTGGFDPSNIEAKLNEMGNAGWELVSSEMTHSTKIIYTFKRPVERNNL
jgi:hypothetical protein